MFISLALSWLQRPALPIRFKWEPALDLTDSGILSALIPGTHS